MLQYAYYDNHMQLQRIEKDLQQAEENNIRKRLNQPNEYQETKYRWVILGVGCALMVANGLMNNIIVPLESKLAEVYDYSEKVVNLGSILSFLTFLLVNIPANHILDSKGIKVGLCIGISLYFIGIVMACLINAAFPFVIMGFCMFAAGQPFVINSPAKIATYWFLPENRTLATSILVGANIIGTGIGFAIPTLVVSEKSEGQEAKKSIFSLYFAYAIAVLVCLITTFLTIHSKPSIPTSNVAQKQDLSIKETFKHISKDRNSWKFIAGYALVYGTFQVFGTGANFLIKPFGYTDIQISVSAVSLILLGTAGAIVFSIIVKRTGEHKKIFNIINFASVGVMLLLGLQLMIIPSPVITVFIVGALGFAVFPLLPLSYQLGCQICFPIGEAQVTGILNGSAFLFAFLADLIMTAAVGFGTRTKTAVYFSILFLFLLLGAICYLLTEFVFKRTQFQESKKEESDVTNKADFDEAGHSPSKMIQLSVPISKENRSTTSTETKPSRYLELQEQK